ncbi:Rhodanese-like protein, partial [Neoconidiobolus thromboides FSU 785]
KDYLIVDVRDNDYIGGHIKGSINMPSNEFRNEVQNFHSNNKGIKKIIFHCALSQVRGPKCATIYSNYLASLNDDLNQDSQIYILRGGFTSWQYLYGNNSELTEDYNSELWKE